MYQRLKDLREDKDLTQKEVAELIGKSRSGYSNYESGACDVPSDVLIFLAEFYGTSIDYMLGETQQKTRHKIVDCSGNRYKELRKKHQMSQVDLAERIGMSQIGYSKYETGRCGMPTTILIKLARIYNVSIDYLLGLTDVEERYEYKYGTKN